MTDIRSDKFRN